MTKMSYSDRQIVSLRIKHLLLIVSLLLVVIFCFYRTYQTRNNITGLTIASVMSFFIGYFAYPTYKKLEKKIGSVQDKILKEIDNHEKGKDGEEIVSNELQGILKDNIIIRNFVIPETNFDIDVISISSKGLIFLEVKNYSNVMIFNQDEVLVVSNDKKVIIPLPKEKDPRNQLTKQYYSLKKYLELKGYGDIQIRDAVVFPKELSADIKNNTGVRVISGLNYLKTFIERIPEDPKFSPEYISKVASLFK